MLKIGRMLINMSQEVKIKLSADGSQVERTLGILDQKMKNLGSGSSTSSKSGSNKDYESVPRDTEDSSEKAKQESRDNVDSQLLRELTLIRKELQKSHGTGSSSNSTSSNTGSPTTSSSSGDSSTPSGTTDGNSKKIGDILGKLASATVALRTIQKVWGYVSQGGESSYAGEYQAYKTYGSTLWYNDYYTGKRDSMRLGKPYGYDYETVMNAGAANMAKAGVKGETAEEQKQNYTNDMNSLLATANAWGIDATNMSSVSGYMSSIGVTEVGDQKKFADMFATSMIDSGMIGRQDEQLQVLEQIAENLAGNNVSVTGEQLAGSLGLYNALIAQNENLKGSRGASMVTSLNDLAASGNMSLNIMAGLGSEYTGLSGKQELGRLAEEHPEQYYAKVWQGLQNTGVRDEQFLEFLHNQGFSYSEADTMMSSIKDMTENPDKYTMDTSKGEEATEERQQNWNKSDISTHKQYEISKKDAKESAGELKNNLTKPWEKWRSNLDAGGNVAVDAAVAGGAAVAGNKAFQSGIGKLFNGTDISKGITKGLESSGDDIAKGIGKGLAQSGDDVLSGVSKGASSLGKVGKIAGKAAVPLAIATEGISTGIDVYNAEKEGDHRESAQEVGGGVGSLAGGFGGAAAGAALGAGFFGIGAVPGAIIGGIIGGFGGDALGEAAGEGIYDATHDKNEITELQKMELQEMYNKVSELYDTEGNNAAQDYTTSTVVPYLRSIGVSQSITDKYNTDVGKPDFMKDIEKGTFGDVITKEENGKFTEDNTSAILENTEELKKLNELDIKFPKNSNFEDEGSNSDTVALNGNKKSSFWGMNLFGTSHATGNDYVPYDNYSALLHKGEMVLTSSEADDYRQGKVGSSNSGSVSVDLNINLNGELSGVSQENQNKIINAVIAKVQASGLQNMIADGFKRVQNY